MSVFRIRTFGEVAANIKEMGVSKAYRNGDGRYPMTYFIHDEFSGAVKIGHAKNPRRRMELFQTGNPNKLVLLGSIPGGEWVETEIHDHFKSAHLRGEWFRATTGVLRQIDNILQNGWPIQ